MHLHNGDWFSIENVCVCVVHFLSGQEKNTRYGYKSLTQHPHFSIVTAKKARTYDKYGLIYHFILIIEHATPYHICICVVTWQIFWIFDTFRLLLNFILSFFTLAIFQFKHSIEWVELGCGRFFQHIVGDKLLFIFYSRSFLISIYFFSLFISFCRLSRLYFTVSFSFSQSLCLNCLGFILIWFVCSIFLM